MKITSHIDMLRPHQWLKNLMLLFPPFLGGAIQQIDSFTLLVSFLSFSAGASSIYIVNDLMDIAQDLKHPKKCLRPLPSGKIGKKSAIAIALLLAGGSLLSGWLVSPIFLIYLSSYLVISIGYSLHLKTIPVLEMFCVVSGFVLRLFAGGEAFSIAISDWLFLSVFLLALYLVCGKRISELRHEGGGFPAAIRPVLSRYPDGFLNGVMYISGAAVLVTYTMYVLAHPALVFTVPLCCFGLLAYMLRVFSGKGGDPTRALLKDPAIFIVGALWMVLTSFTIYGT